MVKTKPLEGCVIDNAQKPTGKNATCVYDIVRSGEVVYVGMTSNPEKRLQDHRSRGVAPDGATLVVHKWHSSRQKSRIAGNWLREKGKEAIKALSLAKKVMKPIIRESIET